MKSTNQLKVLFDLLTFVDFLNDISTSFGQRAKLSDNKKIADKKHGSTRSLQGHCAKLLQLGDTMSFISLLTFLTYIVGNYLIE